MKIIKTNNFKCRFKNSSIPCGKSGGLRFIIFIESDICIPLTVYSKRQTSNIGPKEIIHILNKCLNELE